MQHGNAPPHADRRKAPRYPAARLPSLRASILAGPDVSVINVSRGGLLLESDIRLAPGGGLCLNLTLNGAIHVLNGRVIRADARIRDGKVFYVAGVVLDEETDIFDVPKIEPVQRWVEDPIPPEPVVSSPSPTQEIDEAHRLRARLEAEEKARAEQDGAFRAMAQALQDGERLRHELAEAHAVERARWREDQRQLEARVGEAEEQAASMVQDMRTARDKARRVALEHRLEVSALEAAVRERDQQLAELRAAQAALLESMSRQLQAYEREDAALKARHDRVSAQLTLTEGWCTEQQDLLYQIRQQMNTVFGLLQGAAPVPLRHLASATEAALDVPVRQLPSPPTSSGNASATSQLDRSGASDVAFVVEHTGT